MVDQSRANGVENHFRVRYPIYRAFAGSWGGRGPAARRDG